MSLEAFPYRRIVIIGTTGSGKSTLAKHLAEIIRGDYIELDAFHWEPNWKKAPLDVFRARIETATQALDWVAAGNFQVLHDIVWSKAEAVTWLDYSLPLIFGNYSDVPFIGPLHERICGMGTSIIVFGCTCDSGQQNRISIACSERIGGENVNFRVTLPSRNTHL